MKKTFPKFSRKANSVLEKIYKKFSPKDRKIIDDYIVLCSGSASTVTTTKYRRNMIKICHVFGGTLDKIDLARLRQFLQVLNGSDLLPATKNEVRKVLKRFLREQYDDWVKTFKNLKDIKGEGEINKLKINENTIPTTEEIRLLIEKEQSFMYKAFMELVNETGARPQEALRLRFSGVDLVKGSAALYSNKTKNLRYNPIKNTIHHLKNWKQHYPFPDVKESDFIFPCLTKRDTPLTTSVIGAHLKALSKKHLGRKIYPYMFRHAACSRMQPILSGKIYETWADHSLETATRYGHGKTKQVRKEIYEKVYEDIPEEVKHELQIQVDEQQKLLQQLAEDNATLFLSVENLQDKLEASLQTKPIKVKIE